jgi:Family of unknown function (DUF5996)
MWLQIVGKTLLARCAPLNHWWHTALCVTPRGLASLPAGEDRAFDLQLDFFDHRLDVRTSDGRCSAMPLVARPVRAFYEEYLALLTSLGLDVHIWSMPVEVPDPIPFDQDEIHREYDPAWAHRFWEVLRLCDQALRELQASFVGKQSPVHFFWGGFDLAATRFSGRRAPERPGADRMNREAYSHEVISFGFWPGGAMPDGRTLDEPVLYAYAVPEPGGFRDARVEPPEAHYDARFGEFFLPYGAVRTAPDPGAVIRAFCESVYEAGATLGKWDRPALERAAAPRAGADQGLHAGSP